jgi:hypothetical protein
VMSAAVRPVFVETPSIEAIDHRAARELSA